MPSRLASISRDLSKACAGLRFGAPVTHVYAPLIYAREPHERYLERWGGAPKEAIFLGMNPGPFGMAQTGVPFGDVALVRDFVGITGAVGKPAHEHPKRPIAGFACDKSEVSGTRLWSWVKARFGTPDAFFARFFVVNYCPLVFMEASGANRTPDKLPVAERAPLYAACDEALRAIVAELGPRTIVGVGAFAQSRATEALAGMPGLAITTVLHPSPASPRANRGWAKEVEVDLAKAGIALP
jgi:single-strand selective monofunctional uracil DNA glycosylase